MFRAERERLRLLVFEHRVHKSGAETQTNIGTSSSKFPFDKSKVYADVRSYEE